MAWAGHLAQLDFFVKSPVLLGRAAEALADEQLIIRTGEPLVAKVERETFADRAEGWVSTTKVPLRDESGKVGWPLSRVARNHKTTDE